MQHTLRRQKEQMMEDKKWLEKEEKLLVGNRASFSFVNPLSVSQCPPTQFTLALEATWNEASLNKIDPLVHSQRHTSFTLNVPLITVPKRGSMTLFYQMNLPVLLQDPMGPEDTAGPAVGLPLQTVISVAFLSKYTIFFPFEECKKIYRLFKATLLFTAYVNYMIFPMQL